MSFAASLPHIGAVCNAALLVLLALAYRAIRRKDEQTHRKRMLQALGFGLAFVVVYLTQNAVSGHHSFPGDDWMRTVFVVILLTHTILAVALVPMVIVTVRWALKGKRASHRKLAPYTLATWAYVSTTAIFIYVANNYIRPPG